MGSVAFIFKKRDRDFFVKLEMENVSVIGISHGALRKREVGGKSNTI